jgi:predicted adenylyl cyclase CyaB
VVEKTRTLFLWRNVRIHLDEVADLGSFIELEAVLSGEHDDAEGQQQLVFLQREFGIAPDDLIETSYLEMIRGKRSG